MEESNCFASIRRNTYQDLPVKICDRLYNQFRSDARSARCLLKNYYVLLRRQLRTYLCRHYIDRANVCSVSRVP